MIIRRFQAGATAVAAAVLALAAILPAALPAAAATPKVTYELWLDDECIMGLGPPSTKLTFDLRKPSGKLVDSLTTTSRASGTFSECFEESAPHTGYKLIARKKSTVLRTLTLPRLSIKADRISDKVVIGAAPGRRVTLVLSDCNTDPTKCTEVLTRTNRVGVKGTWTTDLTAAHDALGHDPVSASFRLGGGDLIQRYARFPYLGAEPEGDVYGAAIPGATVKVRLKDAPGGTVLSTLTRVANPIGSYQGTLNIQPGRELVADIATDARITIPATSLTYDAVDNAIEGTCLPDRPILLYWFGVGVVPILTTTADGTGAWSIDLDTTADPTVPTGLTLYVTCNTAAGDQFNYSGIIPS